MLTKEQVLAHIRDNMGVGYYNKEIIKNNKEIIKYKDGLTPSPFGSVADAPQVNREGTVTQVPLEPGQQEGEEDLSSNETLPRRNDLIKTEHIHRAIVQLHHNENSTVKYKLKVRLNADFGDGIENIDFICALTKDLRNFKKYSPAESREEIHAWVHTLRSELKHESIKPYMGKFHCNQGWSQSGQQTNQKEPWCAAVVWYHPQHRQYMAAVRIYEWEWMGVLGRDTISDKQVTVKGQQLWQNPQHAPKHARPKTWAERRWGAK